MLSHIYLTGVVNARFNFLNLMSLVDGHFETAFELYSHAITLNPNNAVYYGNRSFCSIKLENYGDALTDANKALELDKTYIKVCYRNIGEVLTLGNDLLIESFSKPLFFNVLFYILILQAYYRRASANMVLGKFKESLKDYETVSV